MNAIVAAFYETSWFRAVLILIAAVIVARIADALLARRDATMSRLLGREPGSAGRTRFFMIRRLAVVTILFVGVALALGQFAVVGSLARAMLASVALVAAIIGIAARAPIANLVSGVMIAFSQPVRLGDYVSVNDAYGTIEEIKLTYTHLRTADNRLVVIPNETFASAVVNNYSMGSPGSMVEVTFSVPASVNLDAIRAAALRIANDMSPGTEDHRNSVEVQGLTAQGITLRVNAWAPDPLARRHLGSELRAVLHERLLREEFAKPPTEIPHAGE